MAEKTATTGGELLKLDDAADYLSCSRRNVEKMIESGQLHPIDISARGDSAKRRTWRIRRRDLDAFIRSRMMRAIKEPDSEPSPAAA